MHAKQRQGSLLLEAVIAIGLLAIFFSAMAGLLLSANLGSSSAYTYERARWSAEQGIGALRSIAFTDLQSYATAALTYSGVTHRWSVASGSATSLGHGLTRTVTVADVYRDDNCLVVATGGTLDTDSKELTSTVSWTMPNGQTRTYEASELRVNWEAPTGDCFKPLEARYPTLRFVGANWGGSKQLRDIYIDNATPYDATVTKITVWWSKPGSRSQQMFINTDKVWSESGPGTPSGNQDSGTLIDVVDFTIPANSTGATQKIQFTGAMANSTIRILFEFQDGSTLDTGVFTPGN